MGDSLALQNSTLDTGGAGTVSFGTLTAATLGGLQGSNGLTLENASSGGLALTVGNNESSTTFSGSLSGNGSLIKIGNGELVLTGADSYSGGTTIDAGTLVATAADAIPDGPLTIGAAGTLIFDPSLAGSPFATSPGAAETAVPEPSTFALLAAGALGLVGYAWRRRTTPTAKPAAFDQPDAPPILSFPSHSSPRDDDMRHNTALERRGRMP